VAAILDIFFRTFHYWVSSIATIARGLAMPRLELKMGVTNEFRSWKVKNYYSPRAMIPRWLVRGGGAGPTTTKLLQQQSCGGGDGFWCWWVMLSFSAENSNANDGAAAAAEASHYSSRQRHID
jgi:hypothetical protein